MLSPLACHLEPGGLIGEKTFGDVGVGFIDDSELQKRGWKPDHKYAEVST